MRLWNWFFFTTTPLLALFDPKASQLHPASITVAAHIRKIPDPHLHIQSSTVINKDNVATGHRALAPIVSWVPNCLYNSHMLVVAGSYNYLWYHMQSNKAPLPGVVPVDNYHIQVASSSSIYSNSICHWRPLEPSLIHIWSWASEQQFYCIVPSAQILCPSCWITLLWHTPLLPHLLTPLTSSLLHQKECWANPLALAKSPFPPMSFQH